SAGSPVPVEFRWCPGHAGILGNEAADALAKAAATRPVTQRVPVSHSAFRRRLQASFWSSAQAAWINNAPGLYPLLPLRADRVPPELKLPRYALGKLVAARTGHGDFAEYHRRFQHEGAKLTCSCGAHKAPKIGRASCRGRVKIGGGHDE